MKEKEWKQMNKKMNKETRGLTSIDSWLYQGEKVRKQIRRQIGRQIWTTVWLQKLSQLVIRLELP